MSSSSRITIDDFSDTILDKTIYFKIIKLDESFFVWVGSDPALSNMAVAMPAKYSNIPSSTTLFGSTAEQTSRTMALKLAKKFDQQVFISCGLAYDQQLSLQIEKRLAQKLSKVTEIVNV